jgi:hypothetical protein
VLCAYIDREHYSKCHGSSDIVPTNAQNVLFVKFLEGVKELILGAISRGRKKIKSGIVLMYAKCKFEDLADFYYYDTEVKYLSQSAAIKEFESTTGKKYDDLIAGIDRNRTGWLVILRTDTQSAAGFITEAQN